MSKNPESKATLILIVCLCAVVFMGCAKKEVSDSHGTTVPASVNKAAAPAFYDNSAAGTKAAASEWVVDVDGKKLTRQEMNERVMGLLSTKAAGLPPEQQAKASEMIRQNVIQGFVGEYLLSQEATKQKLEVADADVTKAVDNMKTNLPEGLTLEMAVQQRGMTMDQLHTEVAESLKIDKLVEKELPAAKEPTVEEIKAFYDGHPKYFEKGESVHARHVLIACPEDATDAVRAEKKALAEKCRTELAGGADFAAVAAKNSDCPSKDVGGDLGTFQHGQMVKEFEDAAFSQKVNDIGPVVQTKFGYHVIQVLGHTQAGTVALDEAKEKIADFLKRKHKQDALESLVAKLASTAKITYADGIQPAKFGVTPEN